MPLDGIMNFTAPMSVDVLYVCVSVQHTVLLNGYVSMWIDAQLLTMKKLRCQTWNQGHQCQPQWEP
jgi:hypothetical protein